MNQSQQFVSYALEIGAIRFGEFKLRSGRDAPYFWNSGFFNTGATLERLAVAYACAIVNEGKLPGVIYGPAYKGIPLAAAVALMATRMGYQFGYAFNRKEAKDHGEGGLLIGHPLEGQGVVIVDDVMTSGGSCGEAVDTVLREKGKPIACVIALDREEKAPGSELSATQQFQEKYGIPVRAAAKLRDLIAVLRDNPSFAEQKEKFLPKILAYREQYGV